MSFTSYTINSTVIIITQYTHTWNTCKTHTCHTFADTLWHNTDCCLPSEHQPRVALPSPQHIHQLGRVDKLETQYFMVVGHMYPCMCWQSKVNLSQIKICMLCPLSRGLGCVWTAAVQNDLFGTCSVAALCQPLYVKITPLHSELLVAMLRRNRCNFIPISSWSHMLLIFTYSGWHSATM